MDRLKDWADKQGEKVAWSFCDDYGTVNDSLTFAELEQCTTALSHHLLGPKSGLKAGDRALLVFFPGLHFTAALIACFKAGIIAVPVFPPDPTRLKKDLDHFVSIQKSSGANVALTHSTYNYAKKLAGVKNVFGGGGGDKWPNLEWLLVDDILTKGKGKSKAPPLATLPIPLQTQVAFLQYTSGSTSEPKGVMISHGNLAHNLALIIRELKADTNTVNVSWLPQYHDMGLIGSYLGVIYCGGTGFYLSPISFLKNPLIWMSCMSKYQGTHTQAPNFAYALSARKYKESNQAARPASGLAPLNLSSVKHMINAAEPVDPIAVANFYAIYGPLGLPNSVVVPTYGLAEHTVFVASGGSGLLTVSKQALEANLVDILKETDFSDLDKGNDKEEVEKHNQTSQNIVGCGFPGRGENVVLKIVNPDTFVELAEDQVGEIWVDSPSKAQGYWNREEQSIEDFRAPLRLPTTSDPENGVENQAVVVTEMKPGFLRTGDLGFLHNQELFICGRIKDLIIVRGSNHYPQDLEKTAESAEPAYLRPGCSAAFAIKGSNGTHTEGVVLLAEIKENVSSTKFHAIAESIRLAISKDHGLSLACVCLLPTRSILKTTSGKITRAGNRKAFQEGTLKVVYRIDGSSSASSSSSSSSSSSPSASALTHDDVLDPSAMELPSWIDTQPGENSAPAESIGLINMPFFSPEQVREMSLEEIGDRLEALLLDIASHSASSLSKPVERDAALVVLGLDSMTVVQFKGAVESTFHCLLPDEYMFTSLATLSNFAIAAKNGGLTEFQQTELEQGMAAPVAGQGTTTVQLRDEPCCPWFLICR